MTMAPGVTLDFAILNRAFSVLLTCDAAGCANWLGLGFAPAARQMLGSTAIVKLPDADNSIKLYHLMGKAPGMVTEGVAVYRRLACYMKEHFKDDDVSKRSDTASNARAPRALSSAAQGRAPRGQHTVG